MLRSIRAVDNACGLSSAAGDKRVPFQICMVKFFRALIFYLLMLKVLVVHRTRAVGEAHMILVAVLDTVTMTVVEAEAEAVELRTEGRMTALRRPKNIPGAVLPGMVQAAAGHTRIRMVVAAADTGEAAAIQIFMIGCDR